MKTLYVSDLDGTLLTRDQKVSEKSKQIINRLVAQGIHFTFATARSMHSARKVTSGLHLETGCIVYNGVNIIDPKTNQIVYQHAFQKEEVKELLDYLLANHIYPFVYAFIDGVERVSYVKEQLHEGGLHYVASRVNDQRFRKVDTIDQLYEGNIFYLTCIHAFETLSPIYEAMEEETPHTILFQKELQRVEYWMEILPSNVSKANAILELKRLGNYDRIISFGDAMNDVPMFSISDECYAPIEAIDEIKNMATRVIGSHNEDAVALCIQQLVEEDRKGMEVKQA